MPLSSVVAIEPEHLSAKISVLARYLQAQAGASIMVNTIGAAPNRECVIQWTNYRRVNITGDSFNFQIRLKENGNLISFVYGGFSFGNSNTLPVDVGIRGLPSVDATNWKCVSSDASWSDPGAGTSNTSRMTLSSTVFPASGTTYTWLPPGLMPGSPVLSYPEDGATGLPASGFNLAWAPAPGSGDIDYYSIYMSNAEDAIFDQQYWETTSTSFDPVAEGGFTFTPGERWYWTAEAHNAFGSAVALPTRRFDIEGPLGVDAPLALIAPDGTLSWEAVTGADSYNIYRADAPDGAYVLVGSTANLSWLDPSLPATCGFYRVTAVVSD
jgi:hypothetical protein